MAVNLRGYPAFVIDALTHGGMSGGPVVWNPVQAAEPISGSVQLSGAKPCLAGVFVATNEDHEIGFAVSHGQLEILVDQGKPRLFTDLEAGT